jgi:4-diphosphocytidyl-2-C-methyl-D-erythritol kinase
LSKTTFTLPSYAKINWTLRVLGRRPDGFHELSTSFQTVTLHDELTFSPHDDERLELSSDAHGIPVDESNLVIRAGLALQEHYGVRQGAYVHLKKHIPAQGGLGGGSSNAAIALLGLTRLWQIKTNVAELALIGAQLGADVPFFLTGGTALGRGLGTEVTPLPEVNAEHILIVAPQVKVSTVEAYGALNAPALTLPVSDIILSISRAEAEISRSLPDALHNDFEQVVFRLWPETKRAKDALLRAGARGALLAGSGSSVFGIFDNGEAQEQAGYALAKEEPGWRIYACATLERARYYQELGQSRAPLVTLSRKQTEFDIGA